MRLGQRGLEGLPVWTAIDLDGAAEDIPRLVEVNHILGTHFGERLSRIKSS